MPNNGADILDLGFNWNDLTEAGSPPTDQGNPCTMSYGFMKSTSGGNLEKGQEAFSSATHRYFGFSFFELSLTPNIVLEEVTIGIKPEGQSPFGDSFPGSFSSIRTDGKGASKGLNATGNHFRLPSPTHWELVNTGTYQFTITIKASLNGGQARYWEVDPELQVGTGGTGS